MDEISDNSLLELLIAANYECSAVYRRVRVHLSRLVFRLAALAILLLKNESSVISSF